MECVVIAKDEWTKRGKNFFRFWEGKIYKKELDPAYFLGYQISFIRLDDERGVAVAKEWLST